MSDIDEMFFGHRKSVLVSAGTHVMRRQSRYPDFFALNIVDLMGGPNPRFLMGFNKKMDFFEIESNVRLSALLDEPSMPELVRISLEKNIPYSIVRCASVGGTIYPDGVIYDLSVALIALSASVLVHRADRERLISEHILLEKLCGRLADDTDSDDSDASGVSDNALESDGISRKAFIEKLFIPRNDSSKSCSFFKTHKNSFFSPEKAIVLAGNYMKYENADQVAKVSMAVCYANKGCYMFHDTMQIMNNNGSQYVLSQGVKKMRSVFVSELSKFFGDDDRNRHAQLLFDDVLEEILVKVF